VHWHWGGENSSQQSYGHGSIIIITQDDSLIPTPNGLFQKWA